MKEKKDGLRIKGNCSIELACQELSLKDLFRLRDNIQIIFNTIPAVEHKELQNITVKNLGDIIIEEIHNR